MFFLHLNVRDVWDTLDCCNVYFVFDTVMPVISMIVLGLATNQGRRQPPQGVEYAQVGTLDVGLSLSFL